MFHMANYDINNVFYQILQNIIPAKKILESNHAIAFFDINPQAKIHCLVIPKGLYVDFQDFTQHATDTEITDYYLAISQVIKILNITAGFRLISNNGLHAGQEVPHFHTHILAGEFLASLNKKL